MHTVAIDNVSNFSISYFKEEFVRLRGLMGSRDFWNKPDRVRQSALDGFGFVYLNLYNDDGSALTPDQIEHWANVYSATIAEFQRRELFHTVGI